MTVSPALDEMRALDEALRAAVASENETALRAVRAAAEALLVQARRESQDLIEGARREAASRAEAETARERAALRRESARTVLDAKRTIVDDVAKQVHRAVLALRDADDYERLLDGLEARARSRLGPQAIIVRDPPDGGGVMARRDGCRLDYTLPALARLASADLDSATGKLVT